MIGGDNQQKQRKEIDHEGCISPLERRGMRDRPTSIPAIRFAT